MSEIKKEGKLFKKRIHLFLFAFSLCVNDKDALHDVEEEQGQHGHQPLQRHRLLVGQSTPPSALALAVVVVAVVRIQRLEGKRTRKYFKVGTPICS